VRDTGLEHLVFSQVTLSKDDRFVGRGKGELSSHLAHGLVVGGAQGRGRQRLVPDRFCGMTCPSSPIRACRLIAALTGRERFTNHAEWVSVLTSRWWRLPSSLRFFVASAASLRALMQQEWMPHRGTQRNNALSRPRDLRVSLCRCARCLAGPDRQPLRHRLTQITECCIRCNSAPLEPGGPGVPELVAGDDQPRPVCSAQPGGLGGGQRPVAHAGGAQAAVAGSEQEVGEHPSARGAGSGGACRAAGPTRQGRRAWRHLGEPCVRWRACRAEPSARCRWRRSRWCCRPRGRGVHRPGARCRAARSGRRGRTGRPGRRRS